MNKEHPENGDTPSIVQFGGQTAIIWRPPGTQRDAGFRYQAQSVSTCLKTAARFEQFLGNLGIPAAGSRRQQHREALKVASSSVTRAGTVPVTLLGGRGMEIVHNVPNCRII